MHIITIFFMFVAFCMVQYYIIHRVRLSQTRSVASSTRKRYLDDSSTFESPTQSAKRQREINDFTRLLEKTGEIDWPRKVDISIEASFIKDISPQKEVIFEPIAAKPPRQATLKDFNYETLVAQRRAPIAFR